MKPCERAHPGRIHYKYSHLGANESLELSLLSLLSLCNTRSSKNDLGIAILVCFQFSWRLTFFRPTQRYTSAIRIVRFLFSCFLDTSIFIDTVVDWVFFFLRAGCILRLFTIWIPSSNFSMSNGVEASLSLRTMTKTDPEGGGSEKVLAIRTERLYRPLL